MRSLIATLVFAVFTATAQAAPLTIGDTFTLESKVLDETRRINVFVPTEWGEEIKQPLPVLYMPDGGMNEDFLHIAGLLQVSVSNGTMRPFILVGIRNTARKRDLTGPTTVAEDLAIAPEVGGSARFRKFLRTELFPLIEQRYDTTDERALIGESLAGLFAVETLLLEPDMFDTVIASDPSLWWNDQALTKSAGKRIAALKGKSLYIAASHDAHDSPIITDFIDLLRESGNDELHWHFESMPEETHATIFHPAAVKAVRMMFPRKEATGHGGE